MVLGRQDVSTARQQWRTHPRIVVRGREHEGWIECCENVHKEIFVGWAVIDRFVHRSHTQWVGLLQNIDLRRVGLSRGKQNSGKINKWRVGQSVLDHYRLSYKNVGIISPIPSKLDLKVSVECIRSGRLGKHCDPTLMAWTQYMTRQDAIVQAIGIINSWHQIEDLDAKERTHRPTQDWSIQDIWFKIVI